MAQVFYESGELGAAQAVTTSEVFVTGSKAAVSMADQLAVYVENNGVTHAVTVKVYGALKDSPATGTLTDWFLMTNEAGGTTVAPAAGASAGALYDIAAVKHVMLTVTGAGAVVKDTVHYHTTAARSGK